MTDSTDLKSTGTLPTSCADAAKTVVNQGHLQFDHSDSAVLRFLAFVIGDILKEKKTRSDIEGRVRVGSSGLSCRHSHDHTSHCSQDYTTDLIRGVIDDVPTNHPFLINVVSKSVVTWCNVLSRGERDQAGSMDTATASFVRRQIMTETIVREIVSEVRDRHLRNQKNSSNDGFLFALPQTLREKLSEKGDSFFEQAMSQLPMLEIMSDGYGIVAEFLGDTGAAWKELERIDALGLFEPLPQDNRAVWWTTPETLARNRPPYTCVASVCDKLSYIPFELNSKKKELMVQIVDNFQLSVVSKGEAKICPYEGVKFICFVLISENTEYVSLANHAPLRVRSGSLVVVDTRKIPAIDFPKSEKKRFILSVFLTGPQ